MGKNEKMGNNSFFIDAGLKKSTETNRKKGWCLPVALGAPLCLGLVEMIRVMDFTAVNAYLNAAAKILSGK
jgi:hypothetical protein